MGRKARSARKDSIRHQLKSIPLPPSGLADVCGCLCHVPKLGRKAHSGQQCSCNGGTGYVPRRLELVLDHD